MHRRTLSRQRVGFQYAGGSDSIADARYGLGAAGSQHFSFSNASARMHLRLFYACQLVLAAIMTFSICLLDRWPFILAIHAAIVLLWMAALVVKYPTLLCSIDPYVVVSFVLWMHFSLCLIHWRGLDVFYAERLLVKAALLVIVGFASLAAGMQFTFHREYPVRSLPISESSVLLAGTLCLVLSAPQRFLVNSFYQICELPVAFRSLALLAIPAAGFLSAAVVIRKTHLRLALLSIAVCSAAFATSRRSLLTVAMILVFTKLFSIARRHKGEIPRSTFIWLLVIVPVILLALVARRAQTRAHGTREAFVEDAVVAVSTGRDFGVTRYFVSAIDLYPQSVPYERGKTVLALLVSPVPRFIWHAKPISMSVTMAFRKAGHYTDIDFEPEYWAELAQGSFSVTFLGEMWANFGWLGVLLGPFVLAIIYRALEQVLSPDRMGVLWPVYIGTVISAVLVQNRGCLIAANNYPMGVLLFGTAALTITGVFMRLIARPSVESGAECSARPLNRRGCVASHIS